LTQFANLLNYVATVASRPGGVVFGWPLAVNAGTCRHGQRTD
jgi:hypothetical protein